MSGRVTRRRLLLAGGVAAVAGAAAAGGYELVEAGRLPGKRMLDRRLGRCDAATPPEHEPAFTLGPVREGTFDSARRRTAVGYRVVYPPGAAATDRVPVCLVLHGFGGHARSAVECGAFDRRVADRVAAGRPGFALAACDGGGGYWHPHPTDDPLGMLFDEFLPLLASFGLAAGAGDRVAVLGTSMGGYGALLCALARPERVVAAAASAPAFWRSYAEAERVNAGAFDSAAEWSRYDVVARAREFGAVPLRIDCGESDPFAPAVHTLRDRLPDRRVVHLAKGCHDGAFWQYAAPAQIGFVGAALASPPG